MIPALMLGRKGSTGLPGKNVMTVCNRPLMEWPLIAAKNSNYVDVIYISTDDEQIKEIGLRNGCIIIDRPDYLCTKEALGEHAYLHGYNFIKQSNRDKEIEMIVLLFCNAATISSELINKGIEALRQNKHLDSAVTVSEYNMWSPLRARRADKDGLLKPFVPFETFGDPKTLNCDRDSQGSVLFADMGVSIVKPHCLDNMEDGMLPQKWMGKNIYPIQNWGGCDIDYEWQVPQVEYWLKKHYDIP
ncbi:acylneuraminate cytidylyltransferase [Candidatus Magnetoovum chiemensis]|nr:acylneuraminate cytidylyltransferase [Candidatus Magnetoovum chiemensis]